MDIAKIIDHTNIKLNVSAKDIKKLVRKQES